MNYPKKLLEFIITNNNEENIEKSNLNTNTNTNTNNTINNKLNQYLCYNCGDIPKSSYNDLNNNKILCEECIILKLQEKTCSKKVRKSIMNNIYIKNKEVNTIINNLMIRCINDKYCNEVMQMGQLNYHLLTCIKSHNTGIKNHINVSNIDKVGNSNEYDEPKLKCYICKLLLDRNLITIHNCINDRITKLMVELEEAMTQNFENKEKLLISIKNEYKIIKEGLFEKNKESTS